MSIRQQLIQLIQEGKSNEEILKALSNVKVRNLKGYINLVRKQLSNPKRKLRTKLRKLKGKGVHILTLTCSKCKKEFEIRVNHPDMYTDEVRKSWVCLLCKK